MIGRINSVETMGLVDGPGIRVVVFMQGCPLRCLYCHNPETWNLNDDVDLYTPEELLDKIKNYKEYFNEDGGVTFSGGEPLVQSKFLLECLKLCKKENIHTCIDTAGSISYCEKILKYTDLVILDIKAPNDKMHKLITGKSIDESIKFIKLCEKLNKKLWLRTVIVPGINDTEEFIDDLINYIKPIKNVEKVELLPYHTLGVHKYEELGIKYKLKDTPDMDKERCKELEEKLKKGLN